MVGAWYSIRPLKGIIRDRNVVSASGESLRAAFELRPTIDSGLLAAANPPKRELPLRGVCGRSARRRTSPSPAPMVLPRKMSSHLGFAVIDDYYEACLAF